MFDEEEIKDIWYQGIVTEVPEVIKQMMLVIS